MKYIRGFGLIEIIIGGAIISGGILMIVNSFNIYARYAFTNQYNIQTAYLLEEGIEATRLLRDNGWNSNIRTLSTTTTYYFTFRDMRWATTTTPQYVDGRFLRSMELRDVRRNASTDDIATSGTYDPYTKLVTVSVSYSDRGATTTRTLSTYISDL